MGYLKVYRVRYVFGLVLILAAAGLALLNPFIVGQIVRVVFQDGNHGALGGFIAVLILSAALRSILRYVGQIYSMETVSQNVVYNLRRDIYIRIHNQSFSFFDQNRVGDIMARMTGDMDAIRHFISFVIYMVVENGVIFFVGLFLMFSVSFPLTLAMVFVAPLIGFLAIRQSKTIKPYFAQIREQFAKLNSVCQENISGNRVVKAFTREDHEIEKFTVENQAFYDANVNSFKVWGKFLPVQDFLAGVLNVVLIVVGGLMVINDQLEMWQLITINGYLWAITNPMRLVGWLVNDIQRFFVSLDKIYLMVRMGISVKNPENPVSNEIKGSIEFKNVDFKYDDTHVLKNISFKAEAGQTIGIVGPTGAGKTTLTALMCRYHDTTNGDVLIDGINVKDYDLRSLRGGIASAMQDVFLFSDTIEGNVAYGVPDAPLEELFAAAEAADAHGFILKTSDGYDTIVGERGVGLSGGQKQRLSLARALAANPSILILDDTTSAVDMETEHEIQTALREKYQDMTKIIIAHRISSVRHSDLILVLVDGELIESGTHEQLISEKGYYNGLFEGQYGAGEANDGTE